MRSMTMICMPVRMNHQKETTFSVELDGQAVRQFANVQFVRFFSTLKPAHTITRARSRLTSIFSTFHMPHRHPGIKLRFCFYERKNTVGEVFSKIKEGMYGLE